MKCVNKKTKTLDLIATVMIETSSSYENAEALVKTYFYLVSTNEKIPQDLEQLIKHSIKKNKKELYWYFINLSKSRNYVLGLLTGNFTNMF